MWLAEDFWWLTDHDFVNIVAFRDQKKTFRIQEVVVLIRLVRRNEGSQHTHH